jgi:hypothetical protein
MFELRVRTKVHKKADTILTQNVPRRRDTRSQRLTYIQNRSAYVRPFRVFPFLPWTIYRLWFGKAVSLVPTPQSWVLSPLGHIPEQHRTIGAGGDCDLSSIIRNGKRSVRIDIFRPE